MQQSELRYRNLGDSNPGIQRQLCTVQNEIPVLNEKEPGNEPIMLEHANFYTRKRFLLQVYSIILIQLEVPAFLTSYSVLRIDFRYTFFNPKTLEMTLFSQTCCFVSFITLVCICNFTSVAKKVQVNPVFQVPINYLAWGVFTSSFSCALTGVCLSLSYNDHVDGAHLFYAALLTIVVTIALQQQAQLVSNYTMTSILECLNAAPNANPPRRILNKIINIEEIKKVFIFFLITVLIVLVFFPTLILYHLLVCVFGVYLIYDAELIAEGKIHGLSMDDEIIGAMMVYTDIIRLRFLRILVKLIKK